MSLFKIQFRTLFSVFAISIASGCVVHKLTTHRSEGSFKGISQYLETGNNLTIFSTHGMGISGLGFSDGLVKILARRTGFELVDTRFVHNTNSAIKIARYMREGQQLTVYHYGWFPATAGYRFWILDLPDEIPERLNTMGSVKSTLMNNSVSDVIMYQGNFRNGIKASMKIALEQMVSENPDNHIVAITESLGSKIFLDVMNESLASDNTWAKDFVARLASIFMLSNQIPLLQLGDSPVDNIDNELVEVNPNEMKAFEESFSRQSSKPGNLFYSLQEFTSYNVEKDQSEKPQLIAISDPNDLLSYPIPKKSVNPNYYLVNAYVNVAKNGFSRPFKKPEVVNPIQAHLGYQNDARVIDFIVSGAK